MPPLTRDRGFEILLPPAVEFCELSVPPENSAVKARRRNWGFHRILTHKQSVRVSAIRSDRAAIEFRGSPPATATS